MVKFFNKILIFNIRYNIVKKRFYKQRSEEHAQWEIREYAAAVGKVVQPLFPVSWKALIQ